MISVYGRKYIADRHKRIKVPRFFYYQGDAMDLVFLKKLNEKRRNIGFPIIAEVDYFKILNEFEVSCYKVLFRSFLIVYLFFYYYCLIVLNLFFLLL